jgi:metal-responsive CopG/Arc/MetJ family transcriptional regulator
VYKEKNMATKTLNIALDEQLLKDIDNAVKQDMGSRSEYFRRLALRDLERRRRWNQVFDASNQKGREVGISEQQVSDMITEYKDEQSK